MRYRGKHFRQRRSATSHHRQGAHGDPNKTLGERQACFLLRDTRRSDVLAGSRWIGFSDRRFAVAKDDAKGTAEGAGLDLETARPRADYDARARRLQEFKLCGYLRIR